MDLLGFFAFVFVGFTASVDFSSYRFFHPVFRRLDATSRVLIEQGLNRTVGRAMPLLMPVSGLLTLAYAFFGPQADGLTTTLRWLAVPGMFVPIITTLLVNAPINSITDRWDAKNPPADWEIVRRRWETFQALRAWLLLAAFIVLALAVTRVVSTHFG